MIFYDQTCPASGGLFVKTHSIAATTPHAVGDIVIRVRRMINAISAYEIESWAFLHRDHLGLGACGL
jgi:hypothetical protein